MHRSIKPFAIAVLVVGLATPAFSAVELDVDLDATRALPGVSTVHDLVAELVQERNPAAAAAALELIHGSFDRALLSAEDPRAAVTWRLATEDAVRIMTALRAAGLEPVRGHGAPALRHPWRADHLIVSGRDRIVIAPENEAAAALDSAWPQATDNILTLDWTPLTAGPLTGRLLAAELRIPAAGTATTVLAFVDEATATRALGLLEGTLRRVLLQRGDAVMRLMVQNTVWEQYGNTLFGTTTVDPAAVEQAIVAARDRIQILLQRFGN